MRSMVTALVVAVVAVATALAGLPAVAEAQFGFGLHGGVFEGNDADTTEAFGGAHARLRLLGFLGFEAALDIRQADFEGPVNVVSAPLQLSAMLYIIPIGPIRPYLLGGVGFYFLRIDPEGESSRTEEEFGYHGGAGLDLALSDQWVVHGDVRYYALASDIEARVPGEIDVGGWQARVGLTYYFE